MLEFTPIDYMILLIEIMIVSGALGGMVSALMSWRDDQPFFSLIIKHTLTGIVMAMTVPLILNMFSSDLLDAGQAKPLRLFILCGLCIFVALFSNRVVERIGRSRVKHEEQHCQSQVHQCGEEPSTKKENISPAVTINSSGEEKITGYQLRILETLAGVEGVKMSLADLLRHTMIPQKDFEEAITLMKAKGLVVQELSGGRKPMLILTTRGRQRVLTEFPLRVGHY
ncbi:MAG TPA: YEATS-associated helix-containing protein [Syntrophales bacterium]|nr:YEATS-associated helix-containing protein [Syntrophales bacterium]